MSLISIIIPHYNDWENLSLSLKRLINLKNVEIIVVDDSSKSPLRLDKRIILLSNKYSKGPSGARNTGIEYANGDIFLFIDSDILITEESVEYIRNKLNNKKTPYCLTGYLDGYVGKHRCSIFKNMYMNYQFSKHMGMVDFVYGSIFAINTKVLLPTIISKTEDNLYGLLLSQLGIPIELDKEMRVKHLKEYSITSLVKNDFLIAFYMSFSVIEKILFPVKLNQNISHTNTAQLLSLSLLFIFFILIGITSWSLLLLLLWILVNVNFFKFINKNKKINTFEVIYISLLSQCAHLMGACLGIFYYGMKKIILRRSVTKLQAMKINL